MASRPIIDLRLACSNTVRELEIKNQPGSLQTRHDVIEAIQSEVNKQGFSIDKHIPFGDGIDGNDCTFTAKVLRQDCDDTDDLPLCGNEPANVNDRTIGIPAKLRPTPFIQTGKISDHVMKCACDSNAATLANALDQDMKKIRNKVADYLVECYLSCVGNYCDGTNPLVAPKVLNILKLDNTINVGAFAPLISEFYQMNAQGQPIIVGDGLMSTYEFIWRSVGSGVVTSPNAGQGSLVPQTSFAGLDQSIDKIVSGVTTIPGSYALAWAPGTIQMFNYNKYDPSNPNRRPNTENSSTGVITRYGLTFDLKVYYDTRCETNMYELRYHPGFFCLPKTAYCDPNKTMKLLYRLDCGDPVCTTTCIPPVAPVAPIVKAAPKAKK